MAIVDLPEGYIPSDEEDFMNPMQVEYFKRKLTKWREHLCKEHGILIGALKEEKLSNVNLTDRAVEEFDMQFDLLTKERAIKLISKIDHALMKIDSGVFGYCEATGKPIGIERLKARPVATLSVSAQEDKEKFEKEHAE